MANSFVTTGTVSIPKATAEFLTLTEGAIAPRAPVARDATARGTGTASDLSHTTAHRERQTGCGASAEDWQDRCTGS
jgi:hypothetical protein